MVLDRALLGDPHQAVGGELEDVGHDPDLDVEGLERGVRIRVAQRRELEDPQPLLLRRDTQGVGLRTWLLGRAEDPGDLVAAGESVVTPGKPAGTRLIVMGAGSFMLRTEPSGLQPHTHQ